ncbi:MAG TPA: radical SAM protein [Xanthobacteraceae bacterium]|jgi:radical SAM superfamily enzyme YgiQ (UPF0313 family)
MQARSVRQRHSIYIINPAADAPSYHTSESNGRTGGLGWVQVADLAVVTVAALVPDDWRVQVTDESISDIDFETAAEFIAITGKVSQRSRMYGIAREFRRRGKTVIIGGSFATLNADDVRPHADILVTGELEELAPRLFTDLASGQWQSAYNGGQADIRLSPLPRWDLYELGRAQTGALQTSRGCPFDCEFCDVIQYQGRKQRFKSNEQIIAELEQLYGAGCRQIFLVDDNFTVNRRRAQSVLQTISEWNAGHAGNAVHFLTQASIDVAREPELLALCARAGLRTLFIGIETTNVESLRETGKRQNLLLPLEQAIKNILSHGIAVFGGVIAGFDHDGPEIFEKLFDAFQQLPLPDLSIGCLTAPRSTALHDRLTAEGRLTGEVWDSFAGSPYSTNISPARMTREQLVAGTTWLSRTAYAPHNFQRRMMNFIETFGDGGLLPRKSGRQANERLPLFQQTLAKTMARGPGETAMVREVLRAASKKTATLPAVVFFLTRYEQFRYFLDRPADEATRVDLSRSPTASFAHGGAERFTAPVRASPDPAPPG